MPQAVQALLHPWEMPLRGGWANPLLHVSRRTCAHEQRRAACSQPGAWQHRKVWANPTICPETVPSGPAFDYFFRARLSTYLWRNWRRLSPWNMSVRTQSQFCPTGVLCSLVQAEPILSVWGSRQSQSSPGWFRWKQLLWHVWGGSAADVNVKESLPN